MFRDHKPRGKKKKRGAPTCRTGGGGGGGDDTVVAHLGNKEIHLPQTRESEGGGEGTTKIGHSIKEKRGRGCLTTQSTAAVNECSERERVWSFSGKGGGEGGAMNFGAVLADSAKH